MKHANWCTKEEISGQELTSKYTSIPSTVEYFHGLLNEAPSVSSPISVLQAGVKNEL